MTMTLQALRLGLSAAVGTLLLTSPAVAQSDATTDTATESNQIVVRDATTGKLRAPTPAEAKALVGSKTAATASTKLNTLARVHASGARGVRLSNDFLTHHVMVRQPDGSFVARCVHAPGDDASHASMPSFAKATVPAATE